jgi:hypothetical protein
MRWLIAFAAVGLTVTAQPDALSQARSHDSCIPFLPDAILETSDFDLSQAQPGLGEQDRLHRRAARALLDATADMASRQPDSASCPASVWSEILLAARPPDNGRDGQAVVFSDDLGFEIVEADDLASDSLLRAIATLRHEHPDPGTALDAALLARHGMSGTCDPAGRSLAALAVSEALIALAEEEEAARTEADSPHDPAAPGRHILSGAYYEYALRWAVIAHDEGLDWPFVVLRSLELMARAEPEIRWRPDAPVDAEVLERFARAPDILDPLGNDPRLASAEARLHDR